MSLSASTLATQLKTRVVNTDSEPVAISAWAQAFHVYFTGAVGAGVPITLAALPTVSPPRTAMTTAMAGLSSWNLGSTRIAAGVAAYWGVIVTSPSTYFPSALTVTAPTALSGLKAALDGVFTDNSENAALTVDECFEAIAGVIHTACTGGLITLPGPVSGAIT